MSRLIVEQIVSVDGYAADAAGGIDFFDVPEGSGRLRMAPVLIGAGKSFTPATLGERSLELDHATSHPGGQVDAHYRLTSARRSK